MEKRLTRRNSWAIIVAVACSSGLAAPAAHAQPAKGDAPAPAQPPSKQTLAEARTRYERGTQLYNDGDYKLALIEFQRSYELAPNYKILYNIAQVNFQLNNYANALRAFEKYLQEGGKQVPARRRADVEKEIASLKTRTAHLTITANVEGAEITIDGVAVGTSPLAEKLLVDAGQHRISATKEGRTADTKLVTLAGADDIPVELELTEQAVAPPNTPGTTTIIQQGSNNEQFRPDGSPRPQRPKESYTWIGWVATGTLAAGAAATGIAALASSRDLADLVDAPNTSRSDLDNAESQARALAITTDVLIGATVVAAGVSLYFTVWGDSDDGSRRTGKVVRVGVQPGGARLTGQF